MSFNLSTEPSINDIRVGYVDPVLGYVTEVTICEANDYAKDNPGTTFIFVDGNNAVRYLTVTEVNKLTPKDLLSNGGKCEGPQVYKECGPPVIQFFGGGGIGAAGNPIIGRDGSLLAIDVVRGGHGYQFPPLVAAKDYCLFGTGAVLTAVLGETPDRTEVYEGEEDFELYEICEDTDVGYGENYDTEGNSLGKWEPGKYTKVGTDPIQREIEIFQKTLKNPFWTTKSKEPKIIYTKEDNQIYSNPYYVTDPRWTEFMNKYAVSPVKPSDFVGSDEAAKTFVLEWEEYFPITGEYIFRGQCDNLATLFIDDQKVFKLNNGVGSGPATPSSKTVQEGSHIIKVELFNAPIVEKVSTTTSTTATAKPVDVTFTITGNGRNTNKMKFTFIGDKTFSLNGNDKSGTSRTQTVTLQPNSKFKVVASSTKSGGVEQGIISNARKNTEGGSGESNRIFTDHIQSDNDNDDLQIATSVGTFKATNKKQINGRSTYDLVFEVGNSASSSTSTTTVSEVISPKSFNENPMGVSLTIEAPIPKTPQEIPPIQTGRCPPNPIWSTRFPGSTSSWYPVRYNHIRSGAWSKFMDRYAISPVLPLNTEGSDKAGVTYTNTWQVTIPYRGYYGIKGTADNSGRVIIDSKHTHTLDGFGQNNPKLTKVLLEKGNHTITVEVNNTPVVTKNYVDTKIFSTGDWRVPATITTVAGNESNIKASFIQQGASFYLQVDGSGSGEITFNMQVDDNPFIAGIAGEQIVIPSDGGSVILKRDKLKKEDNDKASGKFTAGKKYGPIKSVGAGPGARGPILNGAKVLGFRDADGDDLNIKVEIANIKASGPTPTTTSITPSTSQSKTVNGVTYEGPPLFGYIDNRWSKYMNDFSVSPKVEKNVGTYTMVWKNVKFPQTGMYKFNLQGDNIVSFKLNQTKIYESSDFIGQKVQYTFNTTAGNYDITLELKNLASPLNDGKDEDFKINPMGAALFISKDIESTSTDKTPWTSNPVGVSAILIPPPCARKVSGRGVVDRVIVNDPGNGYLPTTESPSPEPITETYPVLPVLTEIIVEDPGINYNCGIDQIRVIPDNGIKLSYDCDPFGKIKTVTVLNPVPYDVYPQIDIISETGVNAVFRPVFTIVRDPLLPPTEAERLIQVTDLAGLKQTGYVDGRAYFGAIYFDEGVPYAGFYKTAGTQVRVYPTLQESITAQVTTPPSAIQRSGTDIRSNDPRLNIPGTPESTTE